MQSPEFLSQAGNLKKLKRWAHPTRTIEGAESVADHTFRATLLALLLPLGTQIDRDKLIRMLIVHDLPESDPNVGDITPYDRIPHAEKMRREEEAMRKLCALLPDGSEVENLWHEYAENKTEEAHVAHDIDKLERSLQVWEYRAEEKMSPMECAQVIRDSYAQIKTETMRRIFDVLVFERK